MTVIGLGLEHLIEESESLGINAEMPELAKTLAHRAIAEGRGATATQR